jgi:hypothetical protein
MLAAQRSSGRHVHRSLGSGVLPDRRRRFSTRYTMFNSIYLSTYFSICFIQPQQSTMIVELLSRIVDSSIAFDAPRISNSTLVTIEHTHEPNTGCMLLLWLLFLLLICFRTVNFLAIVGVDVKEVDFRTTMPNGTIIRAVDAQRPFAVFPNSLGKCFLYV